MKHNYLFPFKRIILKPLEEIDIESLRIVRNKERQFFSCAHYLLGTQNLYVSQLSML